MIYQLKFKNKNDVFFGVKYLTGKYSFQLCNNYLFIYTNKKNGKVLNIFKDRDFEFVEITSSNCKTIENDMIRFWCTNKLIEEELNMFEKSEECQNKLKEINKYLDYAEDILKKGGEENGRTTGETV